MIMKTAEELLIKFYGTDDSRSYDKDVVHILKEYAEQEVKKHLEIAANEAKVEPKKKSQFGKSRKWQKVKYDEGVDLFSYEMQFFVNKQSITNIKIELT